MAGGKRPSNYARNSTRNHTKHNQSNYFSLWSAPFLQFVPQPSNQLPPLSRHSTEEWLSQESTRSSSLGQGNAASCSSGEDNEISYTIGKTLEQYIEQVADRIGQRETSNYEIQLQRLQEKLRHLENEVRTQEEWRNKMGETLQNIDARLDQLEQRLRVTASCEQQPSGYDDVNNKQLEQGNQGVDTEKEAVDDEEDRSFGRHWMERIENLEAQLETRLSLRNDLVNSVHSSETLEHRRDTKQEFQSCLSKMDKVVKRIDSKVEEAMKKMEEASLMQSSAHERLAQRIKQIDDLQISVDALKQLLEHNLRVQNGAETIVKEQANIIVKHVCAAMQQYTMKRINEYNAFLDSVLKKYLPNYQSLDSESLRSPDETSFDA